MMPWLTVLNVSVDYYPIDLLLWLARHVSCMGRSCIGMHLWQKRPMKMQIMFFLHARFHLVGSVPCIAMVTHARL